MVSGDQLGMIKLWAMTPEEALRNLQSSRIFPVLHKLTVVHARLCVILMGIPNQCAKDPFIYNFQTFQGHKDSVCDIAADASRLRRLQGHLYRFATGVLIPF